MSQVTPLAVMRPIERSSRSPLVAPLEFRKRARTFQRVRGRSRFLIRLIVVKLSTMWTAEVPIIRAGLDTI